MSDEIERRGRAVWKRFFYPTNADFRDVGAFDTRLKTELYLEMADCLRLALDELAATEAKLAEAEADRDQALAERDEARDVGLQQGWKAALDCIQYAVANWAGNSRGGRSQAICDAGKELSEELTFNEPTGWLDMIWKDAKAWSDELTRADAEAAAATVRAETAEALAAERLEGLRPKLSRDEVVLAAQTYGDHMLKRIPAALSVSAAVEAVLTVRAAALVQEAALSPPAPVQKGEG